MSSGWQLSTIHCLPPSGACGFLTCASTRYCLRNLVSQVGQGSGDTQAETFSNIPESYQSSLGLFRTMNSYYGRNGYSLRLNGLEPEVDDLTYERAIVIHGADYVSDDFIARTGRLGRSHGCPAVREDITYPLIDSLREDRVCICLFTPMKEWHASSDFLRCQTPGYPPFSAALNSSHTRWWWHVLVLMPMLRSSAA